MTLDTICTWHLLQKWTGIYSKMRLILTTKCMQTMFAIKMWILRLQSWAPSLASIMAQLCLLTSLVAFWNEHCSLPCTHSTKTQKSRLPNRQWGGITYFISEMHGIICRLRIQKAIWMLRLRSWWPSLASMMAQPYDDGLLERFSGESFREVAGLSQGMLLPCHTLDEDPKASALVGGRLLTCAQTLSGATTRM